MWFEVILNPQIRRGEMPLNISSWIDVFGRKLVGSRGCLDSLAAVKYTLKHGPLNLPR